MSSDEVTRPDLPFVSRVHNLYRLMVPGIDQRIQDFFYFWAKHGPFPITIPETGGLRTDEAGQEELWNQGRTAPGPRAGDTGFPVLGLTVTAAKTLAQTPHGRGGAGDAEVAVVMNGRVIATLTDTRQPKIRLQYEHYGLLAEEHGLEWGGRWKSKDMAHVQVPDWKHLPMPNHIPKET